MTRRTSTLTPDEMGARNVEMADRPPKVSALAKEEARAVHILGGIYEADAQEIAFAARCVRRIDPTHAPELLAALNLNPEGITR